MVILNKNITYEVWKHLEGEKDIIFYTRQQKKNGLEVKKKDVSITLFDRLQSDTHALL